MSTSEEKKSIFVVLVESTPKEEAQVPSINPHRHKGSNMPKKFQPFRRQNPKSQLLICRSRYLHTP